MDTKDEDDDVTQESSSRKEDDMSEDDNSDNDSVDSAQLLADITDVLNSSDLDFSGATNSEKNITVSYLDRGRSAKKPSDVMSVKQEITQDVERKQNLEKAVPGRDVIASSISDHNVSIKSEIKSFKNVPTCKKSTDLSCSSENCQDTEGPLKKEIVPQILKEPVICLTRLDPNQIIYKLHPSNDPPGPLSQRAELSSKDRKARKKTDIKKSAWHEEDSSFSDVSVSDVSDLEDESSVSTSVSATSKGDPNLKHKGIKDKTPKTHEKHPKSNSSHPKASDKDIVSDEKKGMATPLSSQKPKSINSNQTSSSAQSKKSSQSGVKISHPIDKSKVNEISSKNTEKDRKVTEKSKTTILPESRKRRLSKDDRGLVQKVTSAGAKKSGDLKHQDVSSDKDKNQKNSSVETKKTTDVIQLSNWRYELHLSPVDIDDLSNESFRKFINLASDCAVNFDSSPKSRPTEGHVHLYFGAAPQMQSGMQKLCQLSLMPPKILHGVIKCRHIKQVSRVESDMKWMYTEEIKLGFSMYSTWTEKVKQLVQVKDWKREDETKRKFAQIQRIPPIVSKEMISLLFPFSHNVHITKPNAGDKKKDSSGHTSVEFENTVLMETMLSCFRDFFIAKSGNGNPVWRLRIMNFTPRPEKIPERSVTAIQRDAAMRNKSGPKAPAISTPKDKDFTKPKHSDRYQAKGSKESAWGKDDSRKRPFPASDNTASGGGSEKKRRQSEGMSGVSAFDRTEGPSSQDAENDKSNLRMLAQTKGLDPNNVDVLRILEVQSQLTSLQALFSCSPMEDGASDLHVGKSQSGKREDRLTTNPNVNITEAEKQLRENIASKQRQLKELEAKLQQKRHIRKGNSPNQFDASGANLAASLNDEPLDFTKPAPKIEEAVKKDEERSKMFASSSSTLSFVSHHSKGKKDTPKGSAFSEEDFALPLQFGKNVSKAAIKEIVHQNDRQTRGRGDSRQSTIKSGQQKSVNEQRPLSKGPMKGRASNVTWDQRKQKTNFDSGKPLEWTRQGQSKERFAFGSDRSFVSEENESLKPKGSLFQENSRPGPNRTMHQNSDSSHSRSLLPTEKDRESYHEGQRSHMAHEKMWQENFHVETRQFPGRGSKSGSEERRGQPGRNKLVRLNSKNEYWNEFEGEGYNKGDGTYGNRQDNALFFRDNIQPEKYSPLRKSSEPIGASQRNLQVHPREGPRTLFDQRNQQAAPRENPPRALFDQRNQQTAPRENPRALFERQHLQEMAEDRHFGNAWMEKDRFEDREEIEYSVHQHGVYEYDKGNADRIPEHGRDEAFGHGFGFQEEAQRGRGSSGRARGIEVRGRGGMETRGRGHEFPRSALAEERGTEFQRGAAVGSRGPEPQRGAGARGRGHEPLRGAAAGGRGSELQRGGAAGGRGTDPDRSFGMRGRGFEPQRGGVFGGRDSKLERGGGAGGGRGTESSRAFGTRGRGHEPLRGAAGGGRGTGPPRSLGTRGRGHESQIGGPVNERDRNMESSEGLTMRGRGPLLPRGRGSQPQRGGIGLRGRDLDSQGGFEMREFEADPHVLQNERDSGPLLDNRMRGRGVEVHRNTEMFENDFEAQRGFGVVERGRGIQQFSGIVGRDEEPLFNTEMEERGFEGGRGAGIRVRGMQGQRGTGMRGRGREIHQGPDLNEGNPDLRGITPETSQRGRGTRGRGGHNQRGNGMRGNGRGQNSQSGSMPERGRGHRNANNFFGNVRGEQSSFGGFGSAEESFHGEGSGGEGGRGFQNALNLSDIRGERSSFPGFGDAEESFHSGGGRVESFASIPVINSNPMRGRGQRGGRMSQRGRGHSEMQSDDRFEEFAKDIANQETSPATNFQRAGSNRGRGRLNLRGGFELRQMGTPEESSPLNRPGSAVGTQRGNGRGVGFGAPQSGGRPPRGRGFNGPPAPGSSDNLGAGGAQFQPQRAHESGRESRGRGSFKGGQNDRSRGRGGGAPPASFGRGGTARNNQNWPGMR